MTALAPMIDELLDRLLCDRCDNHPSVCRCITAPDAREVGGLIAIEGGLRVAETDTHHIDVLRMMFSWRITETPKEYPETIGRYWCYAGRTRGDLLRAVVAAAAWAKSGDLEPSGWSKNGQTGQWRWAA